MDPGEYWNRVVMEFLYGLRTGDPRAAGAASRIRQRIDSLEETPGPGRGKPTDMAHLRHIRQLKRSSR